MIALGCTDRLSFVAISISVSVMILLLLLLILVPSGVFDHGPKEELLGERIRESEIRLQNCFISAEPWIRVPELVLKELKDEVYLFLWRSSSLSPIYSGRIALNKVLIINFPDG